MSPAARLTPLTPSPKPAQLVRVSSVPLVSAGGRSIMGGYAHWNRIILCSCSNPAAFFTDKNVKPSTYRSQIHRDGPSNHHVSSQKDTEKSNIKPPPEIGLRGVCDKVATPHSSDEVVLFRSIYKIGENTSKHTAAAQEMNTPPAQISQVEQKVPSISGKSLL